MLELKVGTPVENSVNEPQEGGAIVLTWFEDP